MKHYGKGWYNEQYRHSLAAKGISTSRRSFALFKRIEQPVAYKDPNLPEHKTPFGMFKGPEERSMYAMNRRRSAIDEARMRVEAKFRQLENKKEIRFEDTQRFLDHEYAPIARRFLDGHMTMEQFQYEVDFAFNQFVKHHKSVLKPFSWANENESMFDWENQAK